MSEDSNLAGGGWGETPPTPPPPINPCALSVQKQGRCPIRAGDNGAGGHHHHHQHFWGRKGLASRTFHSLHPALMPLRFDVLIGVRQWAPGRVRCGGVGGQRRGGRKLPEEKPEVGLKGGAGGSHPECPIRASQLTPTPHPNRFLQVSSGLDLLPEALSHILSFQCPLGPAHCVTCPSWPGPLAKLVWSPKPSWNGFWGSIQAGGLLAPLCH